MMAASSTSDRTVDRGSLDPVFISSIIARLRHFATAFGLMPSSRVSCESEACDRCIAALTACAPLGHHSDALPVNGIVALP